VSVFDPDASAAIWTLGIMVVLIPSVFVLLYCTVLTVLEIFNSNFIENHCVSYLKLHFPQA